MSSGAAALSDGTPALDSSTTPVMLLLAFDRILPSSSPPPAKLVGIAQKTLLGALRDAQNASGNGGGGGGGSGPPLAKRPRRHRELEQIFSPGVVRHTPGGSSMPLESQVLKVYRSMMRAIVRKLSSDDSPTGALYTELAAVNDWAAK